MPASINNYTIGKGVVSIRKMDKAPSAWAATTAFATGDWYYTAAGKLYKVTTGGTTGSTAPTGTTSSVTDGSVTAAYQDWIDIGNCPTFEFQPEVTKLEHFSSRSGIRERDHSVITEKKGTLNITMDEWSTTNISLAVLGTTTGTAGSSVTEIFDSTAVLAQVKLVMSNDVGKKYEWFFKNVSFTPNNTISLIGDSWGELQITGDVSADASGSFGTATEI